MAAELKFVGSIYVTDRQAYWAIGSCSSDGFALNDATMPNVEFIEDGVIKIPELNVIFSSKVPKSLIEACLDKILVRPGITIDFIVIGCFGPFISLDVESEDYGKLPNISSHLGWQNVDLYKITEEYLESKECRSGISVHVEVDLVALGEFWFRIKEDLEQRSPSDPGHPEARFIRESVHVFLKFSRSINGGIAYGGGSWRGRQHPLMSAVKPRRFRMGGIIDPYEGCCPVHHDCIEGLIGIRALEERTGKQSFHSIEDDHPVWSLVAYYVARLCVMTTALIAPSLIVLGGRIIEEAPEPHRLIERIRGYFLQEIEGDGRRSPDYPELDRPDEFIQERKYSRSGLFGGLIIAERKLGRGVGRPAGRQTS